MALKQQFDRKNILIFPWYIADLTLTKDISSIANGHKVKDSLVVIENDYFKYSLDTETVKETALAILNKLVSDPKYFSKAKKMIYDLGDELLAFGNKVKKIDLVNLSDENLLEIYKEYSQHLKAMRTWGWIPAIIDGTTESFLTDMIMAKFGEFLKSIGQEDKIAAYYSLLSTSEKKSEVQTEEVARLDLLLKIIKDKNSAIILELIKANKSEEIKIQFPKYYELLGRHLKDFSWLPFAYIGPVMSWEYLFKLLNDNLKSGEIKDQKQKIVNHYKIIKKEKAALIKKLKLPADLQYIFQISTEFMFIKDYRKGVYQKSYVYMDPVMAEIAKRLGLTLKQVKFLTYEEVADALLNNKADFYRQIVEQRQIKCCYYATDGEITVYQGEECDKVISRHLAAVAQTDYSALKELKGMTAYPGKVTGIAKIVLLEKDVAKVQPGDILVSSATNPDLIVAMKKAAAFVTDTGGITSHAAIVSRELKTPCVLGTQHATKVIKDGDLVEVDADHGIVKILNK
ncbi:MAG: PEP-utilizing enzyme [Candidatus Parcubacteria bacterium]|nr:PEP-utilizing enzyme [Candidatus Parcubacteria bacterium]